VWGEDHINKTTKWYSSLGTHYRTKVEGHPKRISPISLVEEWDFGERDIKRFLKTLKVRTQQWQGCGNMPKQLLTLKCVWLPCNVGEQLQLQ
jgi:hypothetical protein